MCPPNVVVLRLAHTSPSSIRASCLSSSSILWLWARTTARRAFISANNSFNNSSCKTERRNKSENKLGALQLLVRSLRLNSPLSSAFRCFHPSPLWLLAAVAPLLPPPWWQSNVWMWELLRCLLKAGRPRSQSPARPAWVCF